MIKNKFIVVMMFLSIFTLSTNLMYADDIEKEVDITDIKIIEKSIIEKDIISYSEYNSIIDKKSLMSNYANFEDDKNINSSLVNWWIIDDNIIFELNMGKDYKARFYYDDKIIEPINYFKKQNNYIIVYDCISSGSLHIGGSSDIYNISTVLEISFIPPTRGNNTKWYYNYTVINVTVNSTNITDSVDACILMWNGTTNYTMNKTFMGVNYVCWYNRTLIPDGYYYYQVYANTSSGISNVSDIRYITINSTDSCIESWTESYSSCQLPSFKKLKTYHDTNSCGTNLTLPADNGTLIDCVCLNNNVIIYSIIPDYCNINTTCTIVADVAGSKDNTTMLIDYNGTFYNMTYNGYNWDISLTSNISEDVNITLFAVRGYDDINCSGNVTGTMRFREAFNVTISFYHVPLVNDSVHSPRPYKNDFNYVYLVAEDVYEKNSIMGGIDAYGKMVNDALRNFNEIMPFDNKMMDYDLITPYTSPYQDSRTYFWARYVNGEATITLYEETNYSINIVDTNMIIEPNILNQFSRPFTEDGIELDNEVYDNLHIRRNDTSISIKMNIIELNQYNLIPKIFYTVIGFTIFMIAVMIAAMIPQANRFLAPAVISSGSLIFIAYLKMIWGFSILGF